MTHLVTGSYRGQATGVPYALCVVSAQPALGVFLQQRLDQAAPRVYHVTQVETRDQLESAIWEGAQEQHLWSACLIDTACPTLQETSWTFYTWLAFFNRPVALLDATLTRPEQFQALLDVGFHALVPAAASGASLHTLLSWLVQPGPAEGAAGEAPPWLGEGATRRCLACAALLPAAARFCGDCGSPLPVSRLAAD